MIWGQDLKETRKNLGDSGKKVIQHCLAILLLIVIFGYVLSLIPNAIDVELSGRTLTVQQNQSGKHQYHPTTYGWDWKGESE